MVKQDRPINDTNYAGIRYTVKNEDFGKFEAILASNMMFKFNCENKKGSLQEIDQQVCDKLNLYEDMDELVDNVFSCNCSIWRSSQFRVMKICTFLCEKLLKPYILM
jgi:hypothetical protein